MTERYAVQAGSWSALSTWNGGASLPGVGDTVHANNYTVTIDQNVTVTALSTRVGSVAAAGGYFALTNTTAGYTITANIYAGTQRCLLDSHTSGTIYIVGNIYGTDTTGSSYGLNKSGSGLTIVTGNAYGGTVTSAIAISLTGTDNAFRMYGNSYASVTAGVSSSHGINFNGAGASSVELIGNCYGGELSSNSYGLSNASTSASALVTLRGNTYGIVGHGLLASQTAPTYIYGDAIGGTAYTCGGVSAHTSATGNVYVYGTARSSPTGFGPGAVNNSTSTGCVVIQAAEMGAGTGWPIAGKVFFYDLNNVTLGVRNTAGTLRTIGVLPHSSFSTPRAFT